MFRRCLVVVLALGSMAGCGMQMRKLQREEMIALESVTRTYREPSHRVALAMFEVMRAELASAEFAKDCEFVPGPKPKNPNAPRFTDGKPLPPSFPAFWLEYQSNGQKVTGLLTLNAGHFAGRTRQGKAVTVEIQYQPPEGTAVNVHIDGDGSRVESKDLLEKLADRLGHPANPAGSIEEAAALKAFFGGVETRNGLFSGRKN